MVMGTGLFEPESNVWHPKNTMVTRQNGWSIVKLLETTRAHTILHFMVLSTH